LLASSPFVDDDIAQVRRESIAAVAGDEVREGATTAA
jgi:hypothetical protein